MTADTSAGHPDHRRTGNGEPGSSIKTTTIAHPRGRVDQ